MFDDNYANELIGRAKKSKHLELKVLCSFSQLRWAKHLRKLLYRILDALYKDYRLASKDYIDGIKVKDLYQDELDKALYFLHSIDYYTEELRIVSELISEYRLYLLCTLNIFGERAEEDRYDYRLNFRYRRIFSAAKSDSDAQP